MSRTVGRTKKTSKVSHKTATKKKARAPRRAAPTVTENERAPFDRSPYDLPMMSLDEATELASALLTGRPSRKLSSAALLEEARELTVALANARRLKGVSTDARPFDVAMDRAWATAVRRIRDHAELPANRHPEALLAAKVLDIVHDLSILKLSYLAEFAQIGARLDSLKREGLMDAARTFAGGAFLDEVLHCHARYGEALGVLPSGEDESDVAAAGEARVALVQAIEEYVFQVLALARPLRSETFDVVRAALAPILELRARQSTELVATEPPAPIPPHPPIDSNELEVGDTIR